MIKLFSIALSFFIALIAGVVTAGSTDLEQGWAIVKEVVYSDNNLFVRSTTNNDATPFINAKLRAMLHNPDWINKDEIVAELFDFKTNSFRSHIILLNRHTNTIRRIYDKTESEFPTVSFDKKNVAFLCGNQKEYDDNFWRDLCIAPISGAGLKRYQLLMKRYKPAWFPNGYELALTGGDEFRFGDEYIFFFDTRTNKSIRVVNGVAPAISPDGKYMVYLKLSHISQNADLVLLELSSRNETVLISNQLLEGSSHNSPQWTPDGRHILYTRWVWSLLPIETHALESYSLEKRTSTRLFQKQNKIVGFSCR